MVGSVIDWIWDFGRVCSLSALTGGKASAYARLEQVNRGFWGCCCCQQGQHAKACGAAGLHAFTGRSQGICLCTPGAGELAHNRGFGG
jgi:hypothetical protein